MRSLVATLYLEAVVSLLQAVTVIAGLSDDSRDIPVNARLAFLGLALALIPFLLAKGIARRARSTWLLTLVLVIVALAFDFRSVLAGMTVISVSNAVIMATVLVLLLTPAVRQHRAKK